MTREHEIDWCPVMLAQIRPDAFPRQLEREGISTRETQAAIIRANTERRKDDGR